MNILHIPVPISKRFYFTHSTKVLIKRLSCLLSSGLPNSDCVTLSRVLKERKQAQSSDKSLHKLSHACCYSNYVSLYQCHCQQSACLLILTRHRAPYCLYCILGLVWVIALCYMNLINSGRPPQNCTLPLAYILGEFSRAFWSLKPAKAQYTDSFWKSYVEHRAFCIRAPNF